MRDNTLQNGAIVLEDYTAPDETGVVLAFWNRKVHPYVTWRTDKEGNTFLGHYFKTFEEAAFDLRKRVRATRRCFENA